MKDDRDAGRTTRLRWVFPALMILPALLPLFALIAAPAVATISMSLQRVTFGLPNQYVGLANFKAVLTDPIFQVSFLHTLLFTFATVLGAVLLAIGAGVLLNTRFRFKKLYISIVMIPYAVSEVIAVIIWKYMLDPDVGVVNYVLHTLLGFGQVEWASNPVEVWLVIILLRVWIRSPFSFVIIYSSLIGLPGELFEAAHIDGAGNWAAFRLIAIPLILPAIMVATIFEFVFAFRSFTTVWLLTGGGPIHTTELLSTLLYKQAFSFWEFGSASAIAIVMTLLTFLISLYYLRNMYRTMFLR